MCFSISSCFGYEKTFAFSFDNSSPVKDFQLLDVFHFRQLKNYLKWKMPWHATSGNPFLQAYLPFRHQHRGQIIQQRHVSFHFLKTKILEGSLHACFKGSPDSSHYIFEINVGSAWAIDYVGPWIPACPQSKTSKSDIFISIKCLFYSVIRIEPHPHVS